MLQELFGIETNQQNTTPGELLIQNLQANQAASAKLEDFGAELADGLALSANTISAIEEQLGSRFSNLFQTHLGSHMESMTKSLESIDGKETSQADTFADNLESSLNKLIEQFQSGLNSGARDEMISMQENLAATSQSLITLPKILEETKAGFQSMTQQFQELGGELGQKLAQQIQAASEQASAAQAAGAEAAKVSLDSVASVSSSLTQEMQRGMETYMRTNAASVEQLNELVGRIRGVLEDNVDSSESIGVAITSLTSASKSLNANTQDLQSGLSSMTRMNESMAQVSSTLSGVTSGLENAIRSQGEIVEGVFEQAKQAMADQLTAYGDVNDELSKIKNAFSESLQHYQAQVNDAVNSNLQAFATRLTDVAESLTSAYNALQETVGDMEGVLNRQGKDLR
jgi:predicted transcriptional regulator